MTDTRLPEQWLGDLTLDALSDGAFRMHVNALIWSVKYGQDGLVAPRALRYLHVDGVRMDLVDELVSSGLWTALAPDNDETRRGWTIVEFLKWQTSAAEIAEKRDLNRQRQQRYRDAQAGGKKAGQPLMEEVTRYVARDVTGNKTMSVGKARAGKERLSVVEDTSAGAHGTGAPAKAGVHSRPAPEAWPSIACCHGCGTPMDAKLWAHGERTHPTCAPAEPPVTNAGQAS